MLKYEIKSVQKIKEIEVKEKIRKKSKVEIWGDEESEKQKRSWSKWSKGIERRNDVKVENIEITRGWYWTGIFRRQLQPSPEFNAYLYLLPHYIQIKKKNFASSIRNF
jgi:hypothetical protein